MANPLHFDLILLPGAEGFAAAAVLDGLLAGGRIHPFPGDPQRAVYRNPETGVAFFLALGPEVAALWSARRAADAGDEPPADTGEPLAAEESEETEEEDVEEEEAEGDEGEAGPIEAPPAAAVIPLLVPSFFCREALEALAGAARSAGLHLAHPEGDDAGGEGTGSEAPTPEAVFAGWDRARRALAGEAAAAGGRLETGDPRRGHVETLELTVWDPAKAEAWQRHGAGREALAAGLEKEGIRVPLLQAAEHRGKVVTLCDWLAVTPIALPRTDLVLLRRERYRKGLLWTRRIIEEGLVAGPIIWEILKPWSELRTEPSEMLVFRNSENPPQDILARLEVLDLEPVDAARRASLVGVIDFVPEAPPGGTAA